MTVETIVDAVQNIAGAMSGIRLAPSDPPEQVSVFPFATTYPGTGRYYGGGMGAILTRAEHQIVTELHVARRDLPRDVASVIGYVDTFHAALKANPTLSGAVVAMTELNYEFAALQWNGIDTIGYRFTITVAEDRC